MLHRNGPVDYKIWGVVQQPPIFQPMSIVIKRLPTSATAEHLYKHLPKNSLKIWIFNMADAAVLNFTGSSNARPLVEICKL